MEDLISTKRTAQMLGEKEQTTRLRRMRGDGPKYVRISNRAKYRISDVEAFIAARVFGSTSEESAARKRAA